jgi:hypothetical protein
MNKMIWSNHFFSYHITLKKQEIIWVITNICYKVFAENKYSIKEMNILLYIYTINIIF